MTPVDPQSARAVLHRLRSPVTAIIGFAEILARSAERGTLPQEKLIERLARIRAAAQQINALLDELDASAGAARSVERPSP